MSSETSSLLDPLLARTGVAHGFGTLGAQPPVGVLRPKQVHGVAVAELDANGALQPAEADAVVCRQPGLPVAVVTADCLPILVASEDGRAVAAIHAGWRGLAAGVIGTALARLRSLADADAKLFAAIGPHIRACCYEIDAPVITALSARFGVDLANALAPSRPGHHWLDLGTLAARELNRGGVEPARIGTEAASCTHCDAARFASYRRDGPRAGRLLHWIAARGAA